MAIKDSASVLKIIERSRLLQLKDFESAKELSEEFPDSQEFLKALLKKKIVTRWLVSFFREIRPSSLGNTNWLICWALAGWGVFSWRNTSR